MVAGRRPTERHGARAVRDRYDEMAPLYAELFLGDLDDDPAARAELDAFAVVAAPLAGVVADLGCGPGHISSYLTQRGLEMVGFDLSSGQVSEARRAFGRLRFGVGDLTALAVADGSLSGIVSRYSLIHLRPDALAATFREWRRALVPGAPVLVSFFGSLTPDAHGTPFDHKVVEAYEPYPQTVAELLDNAGFGGVEVATRPPAPDGRPIDQATVTASTPRR